MIIMCLLLLLLLKVRDYFLLILRSQIISTILSFQLVFSFSNLLFKLQNFVTQRVIFSFKLLVFLSELIGHSELLILHLFKPLEFVLIFFVPILMLFIQPLNLHIFLLNSLLELFHLMLQVGYLALAARCLRPRTQISRLRLEVIHFLMVAIFVRIAII